MSRVTLIGEESSEEREIPPETVTLPGVEIGSGEIEKLVIWRGVWPSKQQFSSMETTKQ